MNNPLKGLTPAMMTPLTENEEIDLGGIERLSRYVSGDGINTVFVLGYCGECFSFTREDRKKVVAQTRKSIAPEKKIMAGVMGNSTQEILYNIDDAAEAGADLVLATPTNFLPLGDQQLLDLFTELADKSPLPFVIYNCPENLQHLSVPVIKELSKHKNIIGMKQTSDHIQLEEMLLATQEEDFNIISGNEFAYLASMAVGVDSFIMGGPGNIFPQKCLRILRNFEAGKVAEARAEYLNMTKFLMELYGLASLAEGTLKGMLEMKGICGRTMKRPHLTVDTSLFSEIRRVMDKYEIEMD